MYDSFLPSVIISLVTLTLLVWTIRLVDNYTRRRASDTYYINIRVEHDLRLRTFILLTAPCYKGRLDLESIPKYLPAAGSQVDAWM